MSNAIGLILQNALAQRLDYEVLLSHVLKSSRSFLYAHPERLLSENEFQEFQDLLSRYQQGVPVAYLVGHKEFWSLDLCVTKDTLVPRPETELLVESVLALSLPSETKALDLGTGSGAIALALAHERPDWTIYATDISDKALAMAKKNAERLTISSIQFFMGHWFEALPPLLFDVIVSNPPYIAEADPFLERNVLMYEPRQALISENNGLKDLMHIIKHSHDYLMPGGHLILEHGFQQGEAIRKYFADCAYTNIETHRDLLGLERATKARKL